MDSLDALPDGGAWTVVALLLALVIGPYAVMSREGAEKFWVIGRVVRWVRNRKLREIEENSTLADMTLKAHSDDRARWSLQMQELREEYDSDRKRLIAQSDEDRKHFRVEITELEARSREYWAYIVYATDHSRQVTLLAAKHGWDPPPPRLLSFGEWSRKYED